jgi:hypothetical protein
MVRRWRLIGYFRILYNPTDRERMNPPTLQALRYPICCCLLCRLSKTHELELITRNGQHSRFARKAKRALDHIRWTRLAGAGTCLAGPWSLAPCGVCTHAREVM